MIFAAVTLRKNKMAFLLSPDDLSQSCDNVIFFCDYEYAQMRGEMNSYRFEISNRRENKFCSHEVSFRLHFKTTQCFDGQV